MKTSSLILMSVLVTGSAAGLRQSALSQLGLTAAVARELMLEEVRNGGTDARVRSDRWYTRLVRKGREGYQKLPVAQRAAATTGLFAWARAFTASAAFKSAYTQIRAEQ